MTRVKGRNRKNYPFHGYLSTGAFIGLQMLNLARRLLDIKDGDRIFVTCETQNCLPDTFKYYADPPSEIKAWKL